MSTPWQPLPNMQVQLLVRNVASKTHVLSSSSSSKLIHSCASVGVMATARHVTACAREADALQRGFAQPAQNDSGESSANGESYPEKDERGLAAGEVSVREAKRVGGEPVGETGLEASVEEEEESEEDEDTYDDDQKILAEQLRQAWKIFFNGATAALERHQPLHIKS